MPNNTYQTPRGTRDILPKDQPYWQLFRSIAENTLSSLNIERIDLPYFENSEVYTRGIGLDTDIVQKEMYLLDSQNNNEDRERYALRPEGTGGSVRAFIQNGMSSWPQPVRLYYMGAMFRHDRPQKGRYRQFYQLGVEIFGEPGPKSDFMVIMSAWEILNRIGLKDLIIYTNSIGCPKCQPKYLTKLKKFYKDKLGGVCDNCIKRYDTNPLRLLDCKEEKCRSLSAHAPVILDMLCSECKTHFQELLELLDYFQIRYDIDTRLVRGLDYYSKTVFEIASATDSERQNSLGGGGRYDGLIELLGGNSNYAVGYSLGMDRVVNLMREQNIKLPEKVGVEVCILQLGEKAKESAKKVYDDLIKNSVNVLFIPSNDSLRNQIKSAVKTGAKFAVMIGQAEAVKNDVILRDLTASAQETLPNKGLSAEIKRRLDIFVK